VPLGLGGDDVVPLHLDLCEHPVAVVAGPPGSGRTSVLLALAQRLHARRRAVVVVCPRHNALTSWAREHQVSAVDGRDAGALADALSPRGPGGTVVLVDDVELLAGAADEDVLLGHLDGLGTGDRASSVGALLLAGTTGDLLGRFRGVVPAARRWRTGVLLHPFGQADADLLGTRLPRPAAGPVGRATLVRAGAAEVLQLAAPAP
jgi:S-DNA-T family DNA segregation ATPase FtsK/SpoIIIE